MKKKVYQEPMTCIVEIKNYHAFCLTLSDPDKTFKLSETDDLTLPDDMLDY